MFKRTILLFFLISQFPLEAQNYNADTKLPLLQIIFDPTTYSEQVVSFTGFVDTELSDSALIYPTLEYLNHHMQEYALRVDKNYFYKYKIEHKQKVHIKGLFKFKYCEDCKIKRILSLAIYSTRKEKLKVLLDEIKEQ
jgi:hypothetical protein